eukprot:1160371-Pelagomonas_calceolata.AAC.7
MGRHGQAWTAANMEKPSMDRGHGHGQARTGMDNCRRPQLQSWKQAHLTSWMCLQIVANIHSMEWENSMSVSSSVLLGQFVSQKAPIWDCIAHIIRHQTTPKKAPAFAPNHGTSVPERWHTSLPELCIQMSPLLN